MESVPDPSRRRLLAACAAMLAGGGGRAVEAAAQRGAVPRRYQNLYEELSALLEGFSRFLDSRPVRQRAVLFGGEVLAANGHRGEVLLTEQAFQGSLVYVEALRALGAGGVTIQAAYPLLAEDHPRSTEYWAFYTRLARAIRQRGLRLLVKSGPLFTEAEFTRLAPDYAGLSPERYFAARTRIAHRLAAELEPDWLTIGNEPSSESRILKTPITAERYARFVNDTLEGMKRGRTRVGAGSGSWDSIDYIRRFAHDTALDFIDLHVYPLASPRDNFLRRAVEMAEVAREGRKPLIVGEAWLYKAAPGELRDNPGAPGVFARDLYSFWAPLDSRFLELLRRFGQTEQAEYVSPFWTKYLFSYVDFEQAPAAASPQQLLALGDQAAVKQIVAGKISPSGETYRRLAQ
jgi:hypothetical protein